MFPKINSLYKNTYCDLGLYSLEYDHPNSNYFQSDSFGLGQVFMLKYGLTFKVTQSSEGSIMTFYSNPGQQETSIYASSFGFFWFVFVQVITVAILTRQKF